MSIQLKSLTLTNFKGVKSFSVNFNHITNIFGDNATGKTSLYDGFLWLFFDKNSAGVSVFEVKPLDASNNFIPKVDSCVEAVILVKGQEITVKKVLRQKWTKRRGDTTEIYSGDENVYFWNDVPLSKSEFKEKVKGIIDEALFRLITDPFYFANLKWQDRRATLLEIAGDISREDIVAKAGKQDFARLIEALNVGKSLDEFKREIAANKKKIKDELEFIPSRIDEVNRSMPEALNFEGLRREMEIQEKALAKAQAAIDDSMEASRQTLDENAKLMTEHQAAISAHQQEVFKVKTKLQNIEFELRSEAKQCGSSVMIEIESIKTNIAALHNEVARFKNDIVAGEKQLAICADKRNELIGEYDRIDLQSFSFDATSCACPTCHRALEADDVEVKRAELEYNFNREKAAHLEQIRLQGKRNNEVADDLRRSIQELQHKIEAVNDRLIMLNNRLIELTAQSENVQSEEDIYQKLLNASAEYKETSDALAALEQVKLPEPKYRTAGATNADLIAQRDNAQRMLDTVKDSLRREDEINRATARIKELSEQEAKLAQSLAELEGVEYSILQYSKAQVDLIEERINGKFEHVKFRMFNRQVNGGESECCDVLVNTNNAWVPFSSANTAGQFNAGLDIINTLCSHYNVSAPVFIDNRESVTSIAQSNSQIINLFVSMTDKKLRVA